MNPKRPDSEARRQSLRVSLRCRGEEGMRWLLPALLWVITVLAGSGMALAQSQERDPDLPPPLRAPERRLMVAKRSLRLGSAPTVLSDPVSAPGFQIPLGDGTFSSWAVQGYDRGDPTGLNYALSWGFNTAAGYAIDPTKNMLALSVETNYFAPQDDAHYMEAYLQFLAPDGTSQRPWHVGIPYTGSRAYKSFMLIMTDWFSILDDTQTRQKFKVSDFVALARDVPLVFSTTDGCAGCLPEIGLQPAATGELEVVQGIPVHRVLGNLRVGVVNATSLGGDGSAIANLDASAIASGSVADARLSANVALANRSTTFLSSQYFLGGPTLGAPGVVVQGSGANSFPNLAISNAGAPVDHQWKIVNRGDTGQLVITDGIPGDGGRLAIDVQGTVSTSGDVAIQGKLKVAEGLDKTVGQMVLQNGVATVTTRAVTSNSRIFVSYAGITGQPGMLYSSEIEDGTSFVIHSTSVTDNSPVNYWIIN